MDSFSNSYDFKRRAAARILFDYGSGFCFVARQKRMVIDGEDYHLAPRHMLMQQIHKALESAKTRFDNSIVDDDSED